jgi:hypothetical protein
MQATTNTPPWPALGLLLAALAMPGRTGLLAAEAPAISLADLARKAEVVALAQVRDTDYFRRRGTPVSGSAYLQILITYKSDQDLDLIEIYEKGLHDTACYFPGPSVFEEGRRYLVFLQRDPDHPERLRGLAEGCAADILVDRDHRYAVRLPVTGLRLTDPLTDLGIPLQFSDRYAVAENAELPPALRDRMRDAGQIIPFELDSQGDQAKPPRSASGQPRRWLYTQGVRLADFRALMQLDSKDR